MKKLLFACASLALISSANAAGEGVDHKVNGELRVRYYNTDNTQFTDDGADTTWFQRTKLGYTLMKGDDLTFNATLLASSRWGASATTDIVVDPTIPGQDDGENDVSLHEAHVTWKAMDNLAIKMGRGALDVADGSVISKNEWFQVPYAFDGIAAMYFTEMANVTGFGVRAVDTATATAASTATPTAGSSDVYTGVNDGETNFYGVSVDFKNLPEVLKMVNVHLLQQKSFNLDDGTASNIKSDKLRYGLTVGGAVSGFDYKGTYAAFDGETEVVATKHDTTGHMFDLTAGYTMADVMGLRIGAVYHSDSGDKDGSGGNENESYDPFYYNQHENAGMMDLVNWGNLTYWKLGVSLMPAEMVTVGLDYYDFSLTEKVTTADAAGSKTQKELNNGQSVAINEEDIGQEIDLWAKKTMSNGAEFMLRYSQFMIEEDSFGNPAEDKITQIFAQAKFGF